MIAEMTPLELRESLDAGEVVLVDVREQKEVDYCRIEGSLHIPLGQIREQGPEKLKPEDQIVLYCHRGTRSYMAAQMLQTLGYDHVINLDGGIDRWSLEVDPSVARY